MLQGGGASASSPGPACPAPAQGMGSSSALVFVGERAPQAAQGRWGWPGADKRGDRWPVCQGVCPGSPRIRNAEQLHHAP